MARLTLYHGAPSRSSIVLWMLEEVGEPYDVHLLSFAKGENRAPDYLAINPMGKVPAIRHGDTIITGSWLNPDVLESSFARDPPVRHAVQRDAAGHAEVLRTGSFT